MHQKLSLVKPACRRTTYLTIERAREVLWLMTNRGANTSKLRPFHCSKCGRVHIKYES